MGRIAKPLNAVQKIICPWCKNSSSIIITLDFTKKWAGSENNKGFCVKTVTKNAFGLASIKGCGKTFNIYISPRSIKSIFPPL